MRHLLVIAGLTFLTLAPPSQAHELDTTVTLAPPAVVVRARYGGNEPVPFIKVQVFAPAGPNAEYQNGLTDRNGQFGFVPDRPGSWRVVVDDEEGHRRELTIDVPSPFDRGAAASSSAPDRWMRALTGLSLLAGLTGVMYGWKSRRG